MELTHFIEYIKEKPEVVEDYPFGPEVKVFKVQGKMFALVSRREGKYFINLKCDPLEAIQLRDIFAAIKPGYHMNKKHWNTVELDASLPPGEIERMIDNSFLLVAKTLKKELRDYILRQCD
ncbi:MmcQ/YjbR family DNA-binding protein [Glaciecola sp. 1036]|uniref:MmcQ/YjbR family DNA-binding protein n=1 Tax=Alteromonadaceae TaxID=72275 RepID=UPI003CFC1A83